MKTEQIYKEPQYKKFLKQKREQSIVLNKDKQDQDYRYAGSTNTLKGIKGILDEIQGAHDYRGRLNTGLVEIAQDELVEIRHRWEDYKYKRVRAGYEEPLKPDNELLEAFCEAQARLDVFAEEVAHLEKEIKRLEKEYEQRRANREVLTGGLKCAGTPEKPVDPLMDGQRLSRCPDTEILYIDDEQSKYDGMKVSDYRKLSARWNEEMSKKDKAKLKKMQQEAWEKGETAPTKLGKTFRRRTYKQSELPDFPKEYENMKKVKV